MSDETRPTGQAEPTGETPQAGETLPAAAATPAGATGAAGEPTPTLSRTSKPVTRRRRRFERSIRLLVVADLVLVFVLVGALGFAIIRSLPTAGHPTQATPSGSAAASGSAPLMSMGLAHIPTSAACVLCHESGGSAGLKVVPALGHPLEGWRQCLTCHTNEILGRAAPGHAGIPETECLNCHKEAVPGPTITQPHSRLQDQHCLDCHGSVAHLPSSMASKKESTCTWCHKPTPLPPPQYPHAPNVSLDCRECHKSPEVGNLPIDHALRPDSSCLLCHDIKRASASPGTSASPATIPSPSGVASPSP